MDADNSGDIDKAEAIDYLTGFRLGNQMKEIIQRTDTDGNS